MKQKIVIKVQMIGDKCRSKAMKHAAVAGGVTSVAIEGADKDQLVVIGDGVDSVKLTTLLRKKVGYASIVSVEEVKGKDESTQEEEKDPTPTESSSSYFPCQQSYPMYKVVVNDPEPPGCSIT